MKRILPFCMAVLVAVSPLASLAQQTTWYQDARGAPVAVRTTQPLPITAPTALPVTDSAIPAKGPAAPSASLPVTLADDVSLTGPAAQSVLNTDLLTGSVNGWFDAKSYHSGSIQIVASAGISAGAITFEQTNDTTLAASGVVLPVVEQAVVSSTSIASAVTIAASTARVFTFTSNARYIRARISTAFVGGTVQAAALFTQQPLSLNNMQVQAYQATAANLVTTVGAALPAGANAIGNTGLLPPGLVADVASAALTTTTTTAAITPTVGPTYEVNIPVTAVTGTTPTLDVVVQESDDNGTNWFDVYHFPRITATGIYRTPALSLRGTRVRYVQTVGGTTPSFTRAINRLQATEDASVYRQLIDRTVSLTTLNATTSSLNVAGTSLVQVVLALGVATTPPAVQLEGSDDGANWYTLGSPLTGVASSTVQASVPNVTATFLRARISTAGATVTSNYLLIRALRQ